MLDVAKPRAVCVLAPSAGRVALQKECKRSPSNMSAWSRRVATVADGRTGRGSDDGGGDGNVDGGSGGVNLGGAIDGIIGSRCRSASAKGRDDEGRGEKSWGP